MHEQSIFPHALERVKLRARDVCHGDRFASGGTILQQKTQRSVEVEISSGTGEAVGGWVPKAGLRSEDYLFPGRVRRSPTWALAITPASSTGGYRWSAWIRRLRDPLDAAYEASLIYRRTKNLRAVQLLLAHAKLESTVRYLGIEVDDALELA